MPAYTLKIGEMSFWIDACSDEGAIGLTVATLTDEMSRGDKILLKTDPGERVVLSTKVEDMRTVGEKTIQKTDRAATAETA